MVYMYKCVENPCGLSWIQVGQVYEAVEGTTRDGINFLRFKGLPGLFPAYDFQLVEEKPLPMPKPPKSFKTLTDKMSPERLARANERANQMLSNHLHNHPPYSKPSNWVLGLITFGLVAIILIAATIYRHFN